MRLQEIEKLGLELLDLQLIDSDGTLCGNVDDLLFAVSDGQAVLTALLSGPGTWPDRLPRWLRRPARLLLLDRVVTVPVEDVESVDGAVHLRRPARELGLARGEDVAARWLGRLPGGRAGDER